MESSVVRLDCVVRSNGGGLIGRARPHTPPTGRSSAKCRWCVRGRAFELAQLAFMCVAACSRSSAATAACVGTQVVVTAADCGAITHMSSMVSTMRYKLEEVMLVRLHCNECIHLRHDDCTPQLDPESSSSGYISQNPHSWLHSTRS